jgi:hypothetical protein
MFGFGAMFCVLCDHRVPKREAVALPGQKDVGVCSECRIRWQDAGARCARCKMAVRGDGDVGIFVDRYALGHRDCGAAPLGHVALARL